MDKTKCIICSSDIEKYLEVYDDRYGYRGYFDILNCKTCGHKFLNAVFLQHQLTKLYTDNYPRSSFDLANFKPENGAHGFCDWLNGAYRSAYCWVPENVRVLDIGCGFGEALGYHKSRGCDAYGVEPDENIRRVAQKFGFKVHIGLFDPNLYNPGFFDYVTMDQVVEHVINPIKTLQGIAHVLKTDGTAILSTPNANGWGAKLFGRRWINWHAPYHLQFFNKHSMWLAADRAGLKVEQVRTLTSSEWLYYQWIHLFAFPPMGEPSPFWSLQVKRRINFKLIRGLLLMIHRIRINHVITRLFDSLGVGDNYLFFLKKQ